MREKRQIVQISGRLKGLKSLVSLVDGGCQSPSYCDQAHTCLYMSLSSETPSPPPPLPPPAFPIFSYFSSFVGPLPSLYIFFLSFCFRFSPISSCCWCHCGLCCQLFAVSLHLRNWQEKLFYLLLFVVCWSSCVFRWATGVPQRWPK